MALKSPAKQWNPFFFIVDFYLMRGASDENDVVPEAIIYFYPTDEQLKKQVSMDLNFKLALSFARKL